MITTTKALDSAVTKILAELLTDNFTQEEAWDFISDKYQEALDLKDQMLDFGYSEKEAYSVASMKLSNSVANRGIEDIHYGKIVPLRLLREYLEGGPGWWDLGDRQRRAILWELGFNTKRYAWFLNAGCINFEGKIECGLYIQGAERLDKEWLTKKIDGSSVASIEARFHKDRGTLAVLSGHG